MPKRTDIKRVLVIGSGSDSSLVLAAPGVLPRHAVIRPLRPSLAVVTPASPGAEILVNGARLGSDPTPLMHGDKLTPRSAPIAPPAARPGPVLAVAVLAVLALLAYLFLG